MTISGSRRRRAAVEFAPRSRRRFASLANCPRGPAATVAGRHCVAPAGAVAGQTVLLVSTTALGSRDEMHPFHPAWWHRESPPTALCCTRPVREERGRGFAA